MEALQYENRLFPHARQALRWVAVVTSLTFALAAAALRAPFLVLPPLLVWEVYGMALLLPRRLGLAPCQDFLKLGTSHIQFGPTHSVSWSDVTSVSWERRFRRTRQPVLRVARVRRGDQPFFIGRTLVCPLRIYVRRDQEEELARRIRAFAPDIPILT
jgi:hypothetical protein